MRKLVLSVVALFSAAIVIALIVQQRNATHDAAAPSAHSKDEDVTPRDEVKLDTTAEAQEASTASDRAEVAAPPVDVLDAQRTSPRLRFAVVDVATLAPIEEFALRVCDSKLAGLPISEPFEGEFPFDVALTRHTGGICEIAEEAGIRGYQIKAPGHAPQEGWIEVDARTSNAQTIRLKRGGSISGRVLLDNKPASNVGVRLRPAALGERGATAASHDVSAFLGTYDIGRLKDGELLLADLAAGTYSLEIRASRGVKLVVDRVSVVSGADTSVGELRLASNPVVKGVVLFPASRIPQKYKLTVTCADQVTSVRLDTEGKFTIDALPAGHWEFAAPSAEELVCDGVNIERDIAATVGQQVTLDLRERTGCWLTGRVLVNGNPLQHAYVWLESSEVHATTRPAMPQTNEKGESRAWMSLHGVTALHAMSPTGMPIARRPLDAAAASSPNLEVLLDAKVGELTLDWNELAAMISPVRVLTLNSDGTDGSYSRDGIMIEITPDDREWRGTEAFRVGAGDDALLLSQEHRADCGPIGVGTYTVTLSLYSSERAQPRPKVFRKRVDIRVGQTTTCVFSTADKRD